MCGSEDGERLFGSGILVCWFMLGQVMCSAFVKGCSCKQLKSVNILLLQLSTGIVLVIAYELFSFPCCYYYLHSLFINILTVI